VNRWRFEHVRRVEPVSLPYCLDFHNY